MNKCHISSDFLSLEHDKQICLGWPYLRDEAYQILCKLSERRNVSGLIELGYHVTVCMPSFKPNHGL